MKHRLINEIIELEKLATDIPEIQLPTDAEYQAQRLRRIIKRLKKIDDQSDVLIHGGGTGED
jgi:hypothetical protein